MKNNTGKSFNKKTQTILLRHKKYDNGNNNLGNHLNLVITKLVLNQTVISYKHPPEHRFCSMKRKKSKLLP